MNKTFPFWLLLVAMALTAPLGAQEINAPEVQKHALAGVVNASQAPPLSVGQKWKLFARQTADPLHFVATGVGAAIAQADDSFPEYGQGMEGYGKRYGAGFGDSSMGAFFGRFLLPSILHDDPRYFRQGSGGFMSRTLRAASGALIARHDNGTRHPNYSVVLGSFMATSFGNLYYPEQERGAGTTFERGAGLIATAAVNNVIEEIWPDIRKKLSRKHKTAQ